MRPNSVRTAWSEGRPVFNGWLLSASTLMAEAIAAQGWDSVTLDMQHGVIGYTDALHMMQAMSASAAIPIVRVPGNDAALIGRVLDAGAYGVICPMVNGREACEAFVRACRYAPAGSRSMGPVRASLYGGADYAEHADRTVLAIAMIETEEAVANLEEILKVPGLDAVFVGPSDLSISMGGARGYDSRVPRIYDTFVRIAKAAQAHGIEAGIHVGSVAYANEMIEAGYSFIAYLSEYRLMQHASAKALAALRSGTPDAAVP